AVLVVRERVAERRAGGPCLRADDEIDVRDFVAVADQGLAEKEIRHVEQLPSTFENERRSITQSSIEDVEAPPQALDRIAARRRAVLVRDVAGEPELGDRLRDEAPVQLLRLVELVPAGHAGRVEMGDERKVLPDV